MKIIFQADNDLDQIIIRTLWQIKPAIDFRTANETGLHGLDDHAVLELAAFEKRLLVSSDRKSMPKHFAEFIQKNNSYGLLIAPQNLRRELIVNEILMIWSASETEEWINRVAFLPL
jgi:hypothetical protein